MVDTGVGGERKVPLKRREFGMELNLSRNRRPSCVIFLCVVVLKGKKWRW